MKQKSTFLLITIFSLIGPEVFGQVESDTLMCQKLNNNSFQCKWIFFSLSETIEGVVVKHEKQTGGCGVWANASLTIIKTANDTIRVLDLCNQEDYSLRDSVRIAPEIEPKFEVFIPSHILISTNTKKKMTKHEKVERKKITQRELSVWRSNDYDERILKTTWGQIKIR